MVVMVAQHAGNDLKDLFVSTLCGLKRIHLLRRAVVVAMDRGSKLAAEGVEYVDTDDLDRYMMREFDDLCYRQQAGSSRRNLLFDAMIGCFPEMNGSFPRANRCLEAWRKVRTPGERGPMPLEAVMFGGTTSVWA